MKSKELTVKERELLKQKYNPEGSRLRHDQLELLRMLDFVAEICREHNIQWWLSSGTLLGAARHEGFIPWDDDLDIVLMRRDCKRLEKILRNLQSEEFVYHSMCTDVDYVNCFGKFRKREGVIHAASRRYNYYKYRGIGFDIFSIEKTSYVAARIASVIYNNLQHLTSYIHIGWLRKPLIRLIEILCLGIINPLLRVVGKINPRGEYHYSLGTGWAKHTFFLKDTMPLGVAKFEGRNYPVPSNVDSYLKRVYGDWHKLPSEEVIKRNIHCQEYIDEIYGTTTQTLPNDK